LVTEHLRRLDSAAAKDRPLKQVVFAAPDVDADTFRRLASDLCGRATRFTLYASSTDHALQASKAVHGYLRAGESGEGLVVVDGVDTIDATAVDTSLMGHAYYGDNRSVLSDLFCLIRDGHGPDQRFGLSSQRVEPGRYWIFRP
jgi:esterase/lipase superfamily enzyme